MLSSSIVMLLYGIIIIFASCEYFLHPISQNGWHVLRITRNMSYYGTTALPLVGITQHHNNVP